MVAGRGLRIGENVAPKDENIIKTRRGNPRYSYSL